MTVKQKNHKVQIYQYTGIIATYHFGHLAQLVRALLLHSRGQGFESLSGYKNIWYKHDWYCKIERLLCRRVITPSETCVEKL